MDVSMQYYVSDAVQWRSRRRSRGYLSWRGRCSWSF